MDYVERKPDFEGTWCWDDDNIFCNIFGHGPFYIFIEKREASDKNGLENISGIISDCHGQATFEGEISAEQVKFVKFYSFEAVESGGAKNPIEYEGKSVGKDKYEVTYTVRDGTKNGVRMDWSRKFVMRRFVNPSLN